MAPTTRSAFRGWGDDALTFFRELEANNNRPWWLEHKDTYDQAVRAPMDAFGELVRDEFGPLHVFRPNRDTRFAKDKSPYKTALGAVTEDEDGWMYYVQISAEGLMVGTGAWRMAKDQLARYRDAVADDATGPDLVARVAKVAKQGFEIGGDQLKTAPRGYPRDHPRIDLLRRKGLTVRRELEPGAWLATKAAATKVIEVWRAGAPMGQWFAAHVGPSTEPPDESWAR